MTPFIIAQAKHETGGYKSQAYVRGNNLFGFTTSTPTPLPHEGRYLKFYGTLKDSAADLVLWLDKRDFPESMTLEEYVSRLKKNGYFSDTEENYLKALKRWLGK